MIKVYPRGTVVKIKDGGNATVLAVSIRGDIISYQVMFWEGTCLKDCWIEDVFLEPTDINKMQVGFK